MTPPPQGKRDRPPHLDSLLQKNAHWLYRRCLFMAASLPGTQVDDLFNDTVLRFLKRAATGWFDQPTTRSLNAQARTLLSFSLRQAATDERRRNRRFGEILGPDGQHRDPGRQPAPSPMNPQHRLLLQQVLEQGSGATSPPRWLSLLSRDLPLAVEQNTVARARAYRKGGSRMVLRPAPEAFQQLRDRREDPALVGNEPRWKPILGAIYFGLGPPEEVPPKVCRTGAAKVERYANRALEDLRDHFSAEPGHESAT